MKRTKQVFHRDGDDVPNYVSGCRQFDGEDPSNTFVSFILSVDFADRMKENADSQKQWIQEQTGEKNYMKAMEQAEEQ